MFVILLRLLLPAPILITTGPPQTVHSEHPITGVHTRLTDEVEQSLCRIMNHPTECPHGRRIPRCDRGISCEKCTSNDLPLTDVKEGEKVIVSHLVSRSHDELCSMLAMGFVPGAEVKVEKRVPMGGPMIVSLKGAKIAIARDRTDILHVMRPT